MNAVDHAVLTDEALYLYWCEDKIRFADIDTYGHLNNVACATYAETGRVDFLADVVPDSMDGHGEGWVIARLTVDFLKSAYYPGRVRIGNVIRQRLPCHRPGTIHRRALLRHLPERPGVGRLQH